MASLLLGHWDLIFIGILGLIVSPILVSLLLAPNLLLLFLVVNVNENKTIGYIISIICLVVSEIYLTLVISGWCLGIAYYFIQESNHTSLTPTILWAYCVAISPLKFLAYKDQQANLTESSFTIFFAQIAFIFTILFYLLVSKDNILNILLFIIILLGCNLFRRYTKL